MIGTCEIAFAPYLAGSLACGEEQLYKSGKVTSILSSLHQILKKAEGTVMGAHFGFADKIAVLEANARKETIPPPDAKFSRLTKFYSPKAAVQTTTNLFSRPPSGTSTEQHNPSWAQKAICNIKTIPLSSEGVYSVKDLAISGDILAATFFAAGQGREVGLVSYGLGAGGAIQGPHELNCEEIRDGEPPIICIDSLVWFETVGVIEAFEAGQLLAGQLVSDTYHNPSSKYQLDGRSQFGHEFGEERTSGIHCVACLGSVSGVSWECLGSHVSLWVRACTLKPLSSWLFIASSSCS